MRVHRNINIAKVELYKYKQGFTIAIILFISLQAIATSLLSLRRNPEFESAGIDFFKIVNSNFSSCIFSAIPLTIILAISKEFSTGYAMKLISNGISRNSYFKSKFMLAGVLATLTILLYLLVFFTTAMLVNVKFDKTILVMSSFIIILFSFFVYSIVVSISVLVRNWQYSVFIYYCYAFTELFIVYQFGNKFSMVNYLPIQLASSIVRFEKTDLSLNDYLLMACLLFAFSLIIVTITYKAFKKTDL